MCSSLYFSKLSLPETGDGKFQITQGEKAVIALYPHHLLACLTPSTIHPEHLSYPSPGIWAWVLDCVFRGMMDCIRPCDLLVLQMQNSTYCALRALWWIAISVTVRLQTFCLEWASIICLWDTWSLPVLRNTSQSFDFNVHHTAWTVDGIVLSNPASSFCVKPGILSHSEGQNCGMLRRRLWQ